MGFDPGEFGRFDLAALVQLHLMVAFMCQCWAGRFQNLGCSIGDIKVDGTVAIPRNDVNSISNDFEKIGPCRYHPCIPLLGRHMQIALLHGIVMASALPLTSVVAETGQVLNID